MTVGRRHYLLLGQIIISGLLLAWLISFARPSELIAAARDVSPLALLVTLGLLAFANSLAALRQSIILRALGIKVPLRQMLALNWMGLFANNFLPSSVGGDAAIAAVLQRQHRRLGTIISGLIINRLFGLAGLLLLLPILLILVDLGPLQNLVDRLIGWSAGLLLLALCCGLLLIVLLRSDNRLSRLIAASLAKFRALGATALDLGWTSAGILLHSVGIMLLLGATLALLGVWQYSGAGFWATTTIVLMLQLALLVPITFNGIGMTESLATYCLTQVGWPLHEAVLYSLLMRGLTIVLSLPGVFGYFFASRKTAAEVPSAAEPGVGADLGAGSPE